MCLVQVAADPHHQHAGPAPVRRGPQPGPQHDRVLHPQLQRGAADPLLGEERGRLLDNCIWLTVIIVQVFDNNWHKLHFGVFRDKVVLYVNCQPVGEEPLQVRILGCDWLMAAVLSCDWCRWWTAGST